MGNNREGFNSPPKEGEFDEAADEEDKKDISKMLDSNDMGHLKSFFEV